MAQTLNDILKTKLLTNSSIPASRAFAQTIVQFLPQDATIVDAIHLAQTIYFKATGSASVLRPYEIKDFEMPPEIRGFSDPHAGQSVSDFSYLIREILATDTTLERQYNAFRPTAILHESFSKYLPMPRTVQRLNQVAA